MSYQSALSADEQARAAYISQCGEKGAVTVVEEIMERYEIAAVLGDDQVRRALLAERLRAALEATCDEFELAVIASVAVGGLDYEGWLESMEVVE